MKTEGIRIHETGDSSVMHYQEFVLPALKGNDVLVENEAIGLNFIDVYFRTGLYPSPEMPFTPGREGAGIVIDCGSDVTLFKKGDRVAYVAPASYAKHTIVTEQSLVALPDNISTKTAAAAMLKGMTTEYLLERTFSVNENHTILFYAASGGVGLIASQWAKIIGCKIIGLAGNDEKCQNALNNGCDIALNYQKEDIVTCVKDITNNQGVDVVYDSIAKSMLDTTLACLKPRGMWVCYGQSSGALPPIDIGLLSKHGSLFLTRPSLFAYIVTRDELLHSANRLFTMISGHGLTIRINQEYDLKNIKQAHQDLENKKTTGATIILP